MIGTTQWPRPVMTHDGTVVSVTAEHYQQRLFEVRTEVQEQYDLMFGNVAVPSENDIAAYTLMTLIATASGSNYAVPIRRPGSDDVEHQSLRMTERERFIMAFPDQHSQQPPELRYAHCAPVACINWAIRNPDQYTVQLLTTAAAHLDKELLTISTRDVAPQYAHWLAVEAQCRAPHMTYQQIVTHMQQQPLWWHNDNSTDALITGLQMRATSNGGDLITDRPLSQVDGNDNMALCLVDEYMYVTSATGHKGVSRIDQELRPHLGVFLRTRWVMDIDQNFRRWLLTFSHINVCYRHREHLLKHFAMVHNMLMDMIQIHDAAAKR